MGQLNFPAAKNRCYLYSFSVVLSELNVPVDRSRMTQTEYRTTGAGAAAHRLADATPLPPPLGRWQPVALAAEGTWSRIYRARPADSSSDQPAAYALKTLRPEYQGDARAAALLAREAAAGQAVSHPHLIPVLEAGLRHGPPFLVMPWLDGTTLQASLAAGELIDLPGRCGSSARWPRPWPRWMPAAGSTAT